MNRVLQENRPIEISDIFGLGNCSGGGAVGDDLAVTSGEHDLHVDKGDGQPLTLRIERAAAGREELVEVRCGYYLWAVGAAPKQMFQDPSKEARTVCSSYCKGQHSSQREWVEVEARQGRRLVFSTKGKSRVVSEITRACSRRSLSELVQQNQRARGGVS